MGSRGLQVLGKFGRGGRLQNCVGEKDCGKKSSMGRPPTDDDVDWRGCCRPKSVFSGHSELAQACRGHSGHDMVFLFANLRKRVPLPGDLRRKCVVLTERVIKIDRCV